MAAGRSNSNSTAQLPTKITPAGRSNSRFRKWTVAQLVFSFHYWPLSPIGFGLALVGPSYALNSFMGDMTEGRKVNQALLEPVIILVVFWGLAYWIRC